MKKYVIIPIIVGFIFLWLTRNWDIGILPKVILVYILEIIINSALISIDNQNGETGFGETEREKFWLTIFWPFLFFTGLTDFFD